jgi:glycosyltransferase involved in cell wall biosynthesis
MLAQSFRPAQGGGPRWTTELAEGLAAAGNDVLVLTHEIGDCRGIFNPAPRLEIRYLPLRTIRGAPLFPRSLLDEEVARFRPDVIQTSAPSLADTFMPAPGRYGAPYFTLFHAQLGASVPARAIQWLNVRRLRRGDWAGIAVTSDYWKSWLAGKNVSADRIAVIPSTVAGIFAAGPFPGVRRETDHFLFAGGLDTVQSYKRFDLLLSACAMLANEAPERLWHLTVVGDGNLRPRFERSAADAGLGKRIVFLGRVGDEELHRLYSTATVTVLPSSDRREGWGLVLAEALCCGSPILLTEGIGGASTFGRAPGALVVPAGRPEAICDGLRARLSHGPDGRDADRIRYGASFHATRVVAAYEAMYARVTGSAQKA